MAYAQGFNASGQFLEETSAIEQGIHKAVINIDRIQSLQSHILVSTSTEKEGSYGEERETLMTETKNLLLELKDLIKKIEYENARLPKSDPNFGLRKHKYENLREKLSNALDEYRNVETTYMRQQKERMARQYRVVNPEASQQEIDDYLASDQPVFQQAVIRSDEAKAALDDLQKRHGDIKQIEQTISELSVLLHEMQLQVEAQDSVLVSVGGDVNETLVKAGKANEELIEIARSARKKKCILFGVIFMTALIIIIAIIIKFFSMYSNNSAPMSFL